MCTNPISVYYFQYKQVSGHEGIVGRLSEAEIVNLLPRVVESCDAGDLPTGEHRLVCGRIDARRN